ncbi:MFS transporter, partial [Limosilactobacillus fermentum]
GGYFQPANISTIMQSGSTNNQGTIGSLQRMIQNIAIANGTRTIPLRVDTLNNKSVISRGCFE